MPGSSITACFAPVDSTLVKSRVHVIVENRWRHDGSIPYLRNSPSTLRKYGIIRQVRPAGTELPGLRRPRLAPGVDVVADALLTEGICAEVTPELASGYADLLTPKDW